MGAYDDLLGTESAKPSNSYDDIFDGQAAAKSGIARRAIGDTAVSALKGAISVPEAVVGLADMATGGYAGKAAEGIGFRPKEAKTMLDDLYSPEQKAANRAVQDADGFAETVKAGIQNPSVVGHTVVESLPLLLPGAVAARGLTVAGKVAPWAAGAIGEGIVGAGSAAEGIRQQTDDGLLSAKQTGAALASGVGTAAFGAIGGKAAQKLGIGDLDTALAGGATSPSGKGVVRRVAEGAVSEGVLEELPQSMWEQASQNVAMDRPIGEGVGQAGALGMLAGGAMGAGFNVLPASKAQDPAIPAAQTPPAMLPTSGPLSAAVNAGIQSGATSLPVATPEAAAPLTAAAQAAPVPDAPVAPQSYNDQMMRLATLDLEAERRALTPAEMIEAEQLQSLVDQGEPDAEPSLFEPQQQTEGAAAEPVADVPAVAAPQEVAAPNKPVSSGDLAPFMSSKNDTQLKNLSGPGHRPEVRQAAAAEIARRSVPVQEPQLPAVNESAPIIEVSNAAQPEQVAQEAPQANAAKATPAADVAGEKLTKGWTAFSDDSGSLGVQRANMPQIKAEHRGAMTQFMNARGVTHTQEDVAADSLRPTQEEFSPTKVKKAIGFTGGDRSILVSSDNYVLDGHHQWLAKRETSSPVSVIRFNAPISELIDLAHEFPSSTTAKGATAPAKPAAKEAAKPKASRKQIDATKDTLFQAIAKLGGMDTQELVSNGIDKNDITHESTAKVSKKTGKLGTKPRRPISFGFNMPLHKQGGMSFDGMLEALKQHGYFDQDATKNDAIEAFTRELGGDAVLTPDATMRNAEEEQAAYDAEMLAEQEANEASGYDDIDLENEREMVDFYAESVYDDEDPQAAFIRGLRREGLNDAEIAEEVSRAFGTAEDGSNDVSEPPEGTGVDRAAQGRDDGGQDGAIQEGVAPDWLTGQTNEQAADQFAQQQAGESAEPTKEQADRERDAVPFSMQMQSQPKPQGRQTGLFTADGRVSVEAKPAESAASPASEMDALKAEMGQAIGELASILGAKANLTPEEESRIIPVMSKIFRIAAKMGYIKFKDAATYVLGQIRQMAGADVADKISIENLQAGYINIAKEIGGDKREAMSYDSIDDLEKADVIDERSSTDLERNSQDATTQDELGEEGVRAGRDGDGGTGRPGVQGSEGQVRPGSGRELRGSDAAAAGERGDIEIYTGAPELSAGSAGNSVDIGSGDSGLSGAPIEPDAAKATQDAATSQGKLNALKSEQSRADKAATNKEGIEAIRAALPILTENQQEDVAKAETRFAEPDGYGMLFTNGTGTGKTFTGLGVIKRFANQGKSNILVVAPNDKIIEDWQKSGKLLGIDLSRLADTNDAGKGIVITTYANMGQNNALASRDWDLVVHDEAHYLAMDKDGTNTNALKNLRAISLHPDGVYQRHAMLNAGDLDKLKQLDADAKMQRMSDDQRMWIQAEITEAAADKLRRELKAKQDAIKEDVAGRQGEKRTRALFLSATPFAYEKTVDWANGYIFDYNEGRSDESREFRGYNEGSNSDQFMMQHFGYRMRTGKLTQPDAKVDSGLMQRQFNTWLKKKGSLSGRMLDVAADYDRRFILVDSAIGQRIDEALQWFEAKRKAQHEGVGEAGERIGAIMGKADPYVSALNAVRDHIGEKFDYLSRRYLLESIKAREVVPHIREHLALGRKVVVFHDYKKGGGFNPFILSERVQDTTDGSATAENWNRIVREFNAEFRDIINSDLFKQSSPIEMFKAEFPNVLLFNGDVPQKQRRANVATFQDDASGPQVILVQSAAGKEGISLHDTTGKHQRVLFNLGQPTQPTTAIQQEGRIYRTGQVTDAMFRYLNTGTNWEKWAFATTIAQRASAAENLGMGELARALKDAFISGFEESGDYRAGMEGEGKGGKERDKAANDALTEYDRARAFYFGTQKKNSKTKAQEGTDYFATPEPVGLKMVEWADVRAGDKVLEPSAGHGAIARWIPDTAEKTAIEPSMALRSRLAMVFDGQMLDSDFESLNVVNKFDAIVMNPPFGSGGKMAVDHLAKAATHLRDGGRIVALLPTGPAADKKFDRWMYGEEERAVKPIYEHPTLGAIYRGDTIETNASWMKEGVITRKDKDGNLWFKREGATGESAVAYQAFKSIKPTGPRQAMFRPADGLYSIADIKMPSVTFERAGTQVMTRIVVIEKSADPKAIDTRGVYNRDFTNAEDISDLFDRLENMALPNRLKERPAEEEAKPAPTRGRKEKPKVDQDAAKAAAEAAGLEIVEHTTGKGKVLRGVIRTDLTQAQAKEIDAFTFRKDGGFFIREQHLVDESGKARFARAEYGDHIPMEDLNAVTAAFRTEFPGIPVMTAENEEQLPKSLRDEIIQADAAGEIAGAYHEGQIYLIQSGIQSIEHAQHTVIHEGVHGGLKRIGAPDDVLLEIARSNPKVRDEAYRIQSRYRYSYVRSVEEALADMGQKAKELKGWAKLQSWLRGKLRKLGLVQEWTDNDIDYLLTKALDSLKRPAATTFYRGTAFARQGQAGQAASVAATQWQSAKQKFADLTSADSINTLIYNFQNKFVDLKNLQERIKQIGGTLTDMNDAYLGEEMFHGKVMKKTQDFMSGELKPLLQAMNNNGVRMEEFEQFLHARHAPEANKALAERNPNQQMIDAGRTKADADLKAMQVQFQSAQAKGQATKAIEQAIEKAKAERTKWHGAQAFKGTEDERNSLSGMSDQAAALHMASLTPAKSAAMNALAAKVDAIQAKTLADLEKYGLMDKATLDAWRKEYQHYVPLHRDDAHPDSASHPVGQGFSVKGDASKRRTGSNEKVTNILGHIAMQREAAITRGEKNSVSKRLYLQALQNPDRDFWQVDRPPQLKTIDQRTGFVRSQIDPTYKNKPNVLMVRIAGKDAAIVFNERNPEAVRLAGALKNLDGQDLDIVERTIGKATRWFAAVNTQYNPIFGIINLMRDAQSGVLNLTSTALGDKKGQVAKDVPAALKAIWNAERGNASTNPAMTALWDDFKDVGGMTGYRDVYARPEDRVDALKSELKSLDRSALSKRLHAVAEMLSDYNTVMENAVRLSAYKSGLDSGMTKERAASLAKNLTVNFNRKGAKSAKLGAFYAFFNASVQGTERLARTMAGPAGRKILIGGIGVGVLQQVLGMMFMGGGDDDEWDKIPDFVKERSLIFPVGSGNFISIPMPLGFNVLPNIGRLFTEWAVGGEDKPTGKQLGKLINVVIGSFNPLGGSDVVDMVSPTVADPVIALLRNKDWTGKPIYREDMASLDPTPGFTRTKDSATPWAKGSSYVINMATGGTDFQPGAWSPTPDQIDYVIGQITGGVGREAGKVAQTIAAPFSGDELPAHKIPLVGRLYGTTDGPSGQSGKFYENIKELNGIEREIKGRMKSGQGVSEYIDGEPLAALVGVANASETQVRKLREQRRMLSTEGDKQGAKEIDGMIAEVMKGLNMEMRKVQ